MRIVRTAAGTCLALWICVAAPAAQQKTPKAVVSARSRAASLEPKPQDLLRRSDAIGRGFPLEERCSQLLSLAMASGQMHSARARALTVSWSRELFRRASELPPSWNRAAYQKNSLVALATVDPAAAFRLLPKVDEPETGDVANIPEDLRASAAQRIFSRLWDIKGASALEGIRSQAREIGRTGEYPYIAMGLISGRLEERKNTDEVRLIFREALDFYAKGPRVRSANKEFISYLDADWAYLTPSLQEEALRIVVGHLTRKQEPDPAVAEVSRLATDRGIVSFQSDAIALLYGILPKIRQLAPDWAASLEDEYPDLRQPAAGGALQYGSSVRVVNATGASPDQVAGVVNSGQQAAALSRLRQQAASDPQQAASLLPSLSDPELQAEALAGLATGFATKDSAHAADLLAAAQKMADNLPDQLSKLRALTSLAEAAVALRDFQRADDAMQKALDLGEELLSEDLDMHPGDTVYSSETLEELSALARLGAQVAFPSTMARLDHLKNETLRAYLLIAAAGGLQKRTISAAGPALP